MPRFEPFPMFAVPIAAIAGACLSLMLGAGYEPAALAAALAALAGWYAAAPPPPRPLPPPPAETDERPDLQAILEAIDDPMLVVARQRVTHANRAALLLLGNHIVGEDVRLAIRHPAAAERLARAVQDDGPAQPPIELVGLGERERRWELVVHDVGPVGLIVRLADRTGAYATEKMRVDFVANASHELRTPLATLIGFIETLEDRNAAEDAATRARFLKIMAGEAKRMQTLVADLMSLSRIEAEQYSTPQTALDLAPLAAEVRDALQPGILADKGLVLIDVQDDLPTVAGDRAQLSQLLHNLIGNALKYGRAETPVQVTLARAGAMVRLSVADEGDGIAAEHIPRLTERFYRVDPGRSRALGGTGLGLAIVKHIVERHRGRLDVESVVGKGTTVSVLLPVARAPLSSKRHGNVT